MKNINAPPNIEAYFDASYHSEKHSHYGFVIKEANGRKLVTKKGKIRFSNPNKIVCRNVQQAEYKSLLQLLYWIRDNNYKVNYIYGDNHTVIEHVKGNVHIRNNGKKDKEFMRLRNQVLRLMLECEFKPHNLIWINREQNWIADKLSKNY